MDILNSDWLTFGPLNNTYICKKLHFKLFEEFIINARTDRYNIMCSIDAYEKEHRSSIYEYDSSGGGFPLPINTTTEVLIFFVEIIYFIYCWLKSLEHIFLKHFYMCTDLWNNC